MNEKIKLPPHRIFLALGILLVFASLTLAAHNFRESYRAGQAANDVLLRLRGAPAFQLAGDTPDDPAPLAGTAENAYIGILTLPSLNIELPVAEIWDENRLTVSPCRYSGSPGSGDLVIAGHNYSTHFGSLRRLSAGDTVLFTAISGRQFVYKVSAVETLLPWQVEDMTRKADWDLTLFTCTVSGTERLVVRCSAADGAYVAGDLR